MLTTEKSRQPFVSGSNVVRLGIYAFIAWWVLDWLVLRATLAPADYFACREAGGACIAFLQEKWRLILFGLFPWDEQWRAALASVLILGLVAAVATPAFSAGKGRRAALLAAGGAVFLLICWLLFGGYGLTSVPLRQLSGLPMTLFMATSGLALSFLLGCLLALGRRSDMPVIRWMCTGYIEFIRSVPLISALFLAVFALPLVLPAGWDVPPFLRALAAYVMFFAAYKAENIRGGLQAIPPGQYAAARAIGMNYWQIHRIVILPQAIRISLPSLINTAIAGVKDTSLVMVVSMLDLLGTANAAKADPAWQGLFIEAYVFVGLIFVLICTAMSRYGRWLEGRLNTQANRKAS